MRLVALPGFGDLKVGHVATLESQAVSVGGKKKIILSAVMMN